MDCSNFLRSLASHEARSKDRLTWGTKDGREQLKGTKRMLTRQTGMEWKVLYHHHTHTHTETHRDPQAADRLWYNGTADRARDPSLS